LASELSRAEYSAPRSPLAARAKPL
jgi:hypothetical protein